MAINQQDTQVEEGGENKDAVVFTFTNGAKQQLEELQKHYKKDTSLDVVKLAISLLQKLKEVDEEKRKKRDDNETAE